MRPRVRLGPLRIPLQRRHLGNVHVLGQLGDVSFPDRILGRRLERAGIALRGDVLMFAAIGLFLRRQRHGAGFGPGFQIAGPHPAFASMRWCHEGPPKADPREAPA
jgi:hypothetical protein